MSPHTVTLVVTAHRIDFLTDCLLSVAHQTSRAFDVVLCADTTGYPQVSTVFESAIQLLAPRSVRMVTVDGGTAGRVRNHGMKFADTKFVAYLDGDDLLHPQAVAGMLREIRERPKGDIFCSGMIRLHGDGGVEPLPDSLTYRPPAWLYERDPELEGHATFMNQFSVIRKVMWLKYPFYEETSGEDIDFMLHQLLLGRFVKVPQLYYYYRDTVNSFSKVDYELGDLCTRRYQEGYYRRLLEVSSKRFARINLAGYSL